jgi:hypothetical protein
MTVAIPIIGTGIVGLAAGCLISLIYGWALPRGALWGAVGGFAFGIAAAIVSAIGS